jgi:hypothetical protein
VPTFAAAASLRIADLRASDLPYNAAILRLVVLVVLLFALALPAGAAATSFHYDVIKLLDDPLEAVNRGSDLDVLLPTRMTTEFKRLYSEGKGRAGRYEFEIGAVRNCNQATACFVAVFSARRGAGPSAKHRLALAGGRKGWFSPSRCGASCGAATLEWLEDDVLHTIEAKLGTQSTERKILKRLADSAIRHGPR